MLEVKIECWKVRQNRRFRGVQLVDGQQRPTLAGEREHGSLLGDLECISFWSPSTGDLRYGVGDPPLKKCFFEFPARSRNSPPSGQCSQTIQVDRNLQARVTALEFSTQACKSIPRTHFGTIRCLRQGALVVVTGL